MSDPASDKVTFIEELSSTSRRRIVQGEFGGGSSSNDQPVAVADERKVLLSVVIENPASPQPQPRDVWLSSILEEGAESSSSSSNTMPKVPNMLRQVDSNKKCYDPEVVSIGPYHHGKPELESMEKLKIRFTREYVESCCKTLTLTEALAAEQLYNKVAEVAGEARKCYDEESTKGFHETAFIRMMFLDGCFILQYIHHRCARDNNKDEQAKMKMKNHDIAFVRRDLFLLENQLPFKVLQALMSMNSEFAGDNGLKRIKEFVSNGRASPPEDSILEKVENFITKYITDRKRRQQPKSNSEDEPAHLLEVMYRQLINPDTFKIVDENKTVPEKKRGGGSCYSYSQHSWARLKQRVFRKEGGGNSWYSYRSVQELKAAGIQFRPNKESSFFTDARYEPQFIRAILRLAPMTIDDSTQALLLNLVAYEMSPGCPNDFGITSYISFMDTLIDQADDVKELRKRGIILNFLGSDQQVADLFNEITKNLAPNPLAYENVKNQIEKHYKNKVRLWMTEWLHTHFDTPWTILAFLGVVLAIALSIVQTYYAINPK